MNIDREPADLFRVAWDIGVQGSEWAVPGVHARHMEDPHSFQGAKHLRSEHRTPGARKVAFFETTWAGVWQRADRFISQNHPDINRIVGLRMLENGTLEIQCSPGVSPQ